MFLYTKAYNTQTDISYLIILKHYILIISTIFLHLHKVDFGQIC